MTLATMLGGQPTLIQLRILEIADRVFEGRARRYYGGVLAEAEVLAFQSLR